MDKSISYQSKLANRLRDLIKEYKRFFYLLPFLVSKLETVFRSSEEKANTLLTGKRLE